jgi:hypothetical protein
MKRISFKVVFAALAKISLPEAIVVKNLKSFDF